MLLEASLYCTRGLVPSEEVLGHIETTTNRDAFAVVFDYTRLITSLIYIYIYKFLRAIVVCLRIEREEP